MRRTLQIWIVGTLLLAVLGLAACGGGTAPDGTDAGGEQPAVEPTTLEIGTEGEQLAFDITELTVEAGQEVTLVFNNESTSQQHNWILVDGGDDVAEQVNQAAQEAGPENEYIPESDQIIAHTDLLDGGETDEVTFTAPLTPGEYTYFCSFPGHYPAGMKGTLVVE